MYEGARLVRCRDDESSFYNNPADSVLLIASTNTSVAIWSQRKSDQEIKISEESA